MSKGRQLIEEDNSPPEIQAIRKAFVDEFMRTGQFNSWMHQQLLGYAITQRDPDAAPNAYVSHKKTKR